MLYASNLGLEVIIPAPLSGARRRRGRMLGAYDEGSCAEGKDFVCGPVNGVDSCRPCNTPQLSAFKQLQTNINRLLVAYGLPPSYRLDVDGRIGPLTAAAFAQVGPRAAKNNTPTAAIQAVINAAVASTTSEDTYRAMAIYVPELNGYLGPIADRLGAPQDVPPAPTTPSDGGNGPIPVPGSGEPPITTGIIRPRPGLAPMLAMVGGVVGLGLAVYGVKKYRERHT